MTMPVLGTSEKDTWSVPGQRVKADRDHLTDSVVFTVKVAGRELRVTLLERVDQLESLRDNWKALLTRSGGRSAFLTWEWLYLWSQRFIRGKRRLFVLVVEDGREVIGIAPWYLDVIAVGPIRARQIGFLGVPEAGSDYLDVVCAKASERLVAETLVAFLFGPASSRWDTLALKDIPAGSRFLCRFISQLRRCGKHYIVDEGAFCPNVQLPASFDTYLAQLSSHGRRAYRRKVRGLQATGFVEHVVLQGADEVRCGLGTLRDLYEQRWGRTEAAADLFALIESYLPYAEAAWGIELSLLQVDGRAVAGLLHLTNRRTIYQYLMAIDRSFRPTLSVGNLICGMNIERAIAHGFTEYDFLKSEEDYKFQFMTHSRRAMNLTLHNRTPRSVAAWGVRVAQSLGKILLR